MDTYFTDRSLIRRVHGERVVALAVPRALLMMAAHPLAFEGFFASTSGLADPYARLRRTAHVLRAIIWGRRDRADMLARQVRAVHRRANGTLAVEAGPYPAGAPYAADDPELLYEAYWHDHQVLGRCFGLLPRDMPATGSAFQRYMHGMLSSGTLVVTPRARELGHRIVLRAPVPAPLIPLSELASFVTTGLLPAGLRRQYGLRWDPVRALTLAVGAAYTRRVVAPLTPPALRRTRSRGDRCRSRLTKPH
jgi:uncharacterized protein (DUF2236 family)